MPLSRGVGQIRELASIDFRAKSPHGGVRFVSDHRPERAFSDASDSTLGELGVTALLNGMKMDLSRGLPWGTSMVVETEIMVIGMEGFSIVDSGGAVRIYVRIVH